MNWLKLKAFGWFLKFLKGKIKSAGADINEFYLNLYTMSINKFMSWCLNKLATRNLDVITFPDYLKELNNPLRDDVEEYIDAAIDGLDPRR